jgi:hypothetical protein
MFGITKANGIYTITFKNNMPTQTTKSFWLAIETKILGW